MREGGGKGDKQRPLTVPKEHFDNNWDTIFKKAIGEHLVKEVFKGDTSGAPLLKDQYITPED